jgi:hypothetical protein
MANPQLVRSLLDRCGWLASIAGYPLKSAMQTVIKIVKEGSGVGTAHVNNNSDTVIYLPRSTDNYSSAFMTSPGRRNIPACTPPPMD